VKLGFVSAIFPDLSLEEVLKFASEQGFSCVELMCWPVGKAERRYAGVTHIDAAKFGKGDAMRVRELLSQYGISVSGLGYYPNPLAPDRREAKVYTDHIKRVIRAAELLRVKVVNSFIGRDPTKSVDDNWPAFKKTWKPLVKFAADHGVKIGIENCPMLFTGDEWPGGKNLAHSPAIWRRMFNEIPSRHFGLNYDPSHLMWQQIDYVKPLHEFRNKIFHVHAKDARVDHARLAEVGVLATPLEWHSPKLPGLGDVEWGRFFSALTDIGYRGSVCIEVEDRAYEPGLNLRKAAVKQSKSFLSQYLC